jgi:hypothetical protein
LHIRSEQNLYTFRFQPSAVLLESSRVSRKVFPRTKLQRIHKD